MVTFRFGERITTESTRGHTNWLLIIEVYMYLLVRGMIINILNKYFNTLKNIFNSSKMSKKIYKKSQKKISFRMIEYIHITLNYTYISYGQGHIHDSNFGDKYIWNL